MVVLLILVALGAVALKLYRLWYDRPKKRVLDVLVAARRRNGRCWVTFKVSGEDTLECCVPPALYDSLQFGDKGRLTLRENRYLGFEKRE